MLLIPNYFKWFQRLFPLAATKRIYIWMILITLIPAFLTITFAAYSVYKVYEEQTNEKLWTVANLLEDHFSKSFEGILKSHNAQNKPINEQIETLNLELQPIVNHVASSFPNIGMGYYSIGLDRVVAIAPFNKQMLIEIPHSYPYFKIYKTGQETLVEDRNSVGWNGKAVISYARPIKYQGKIIGHVWASAKLEDVYFKILVKVVMLLIIWLSVLSIILMMILRLSKRLKYELEEFSRAVVNNEEMSNPALHELVPIYNLVKLHNQKLLEYAITVETSNDAIISGNLEGTILNWNNGAEKIFGYTYEETAGKNVSVLVPEQNRNLVKKTLLKISGDKDLQQLKHFDTKYVTKDGREIDVSVSLTALSDFSGEVTGFSIIVRDITERKMAEQAIRKSQEQFYKVFHLSPDLMIITEPQSGKIIEVNNAFTKVLGYTREDIIGTSVYELKIVDRNTREEILESLNRESPVRNLEMKYFTKEGTEVIIFTSIDFIELEGKTYVFSSSKDITEIKKYEKEIARLDTLNLVGQLSAGISHEVRNPMTSVRGFLQLLSEKDRYKDDKEIFYLMINELDRANAIISEFLSLAQTKASAVKPVNLNSIISTLYPLISADAIKMDKNLIFKEGVIPALLLDEKDMRQLILNLVRNGLEAVGSGGTVELSTYVKDDNVTLEIKDNGPGIPKEIFTNLGTPFVTTKDTGTGLGLSVCYSIAKRHNANIEVENSCKGATFYIKFKFVEVN